MIGGNRANLYADNILHIELDALARQHPLLRANLTCHLICQRNTLALGSNQIIKLRCLLQQFGRARLRQLTVAENDKSTDRELVIEPGQMGKSRSQPAIVIW